MLRAIFVCFLSKFELCVGFAHGDSHRCSNARNIQRLLGKDTGCAETVVAMMFSFDKYSHLVILAHVYELHILLRAKYRIKTLETRLRSSDFNILVTFDFSL